MRNAIILCAITAGGVMIPSEERRLNMIGGKAGTHSMGGGTHSMGFNPGMGGGSTGLLPGVPTPHATGYRPKPNILPGVPTPLTPIPTPTHFRPKPTNLIGGCGGMQRGVCGRGQVCRGGRCVPRRNPFPPYIPPYNPYPVPIYPPYNPYPQTIVTYCMVYVNYWGNSNIQRYFQDDLNVQFDSNGQPVGQICIQSVSTSICPSGWKDLWDNQCLGSTAYLPLFGVSPTTSASSPGLLGASAPADSQAQGQATMTEDQVEGLLASAHNDSAGN